MRVFLARFGVFVVVLVVVHFSGAFVSFVRAVFPSFHSFHSPICHSTPAALLAANAEYIRNRIPKCNRLSESYMKKNMMHIFRYPVNILFSPKTTYRRDYKMNMLFMGMSVYSFFLSSTPPHIFCLFLIPQRFNGDLAVHHK